MGKQLETQRRGKGSPTFMAKHYGINSSYISLRDISLDTLIRGQVTELIKESGRSVPIAKVLFENGAVQQCVAPEGISIGQRIEHGAEAKAEIGNILPLRNIPEGCPVFNIERELGDGGKFVRSSGLYALVVSKDEKFASVKLPSNKLVNIPLSNRATVGCVASGERTDKPFMTAGAKYHFIASKGGRFWPMVRGVAKNAYTHPFGGEQHHPGKSKSVSRHAPPGRKVGAIASRRTGRKKKN